MYAPSSELGPPPPPPHPDVSVSPPLDPKGGEPHSFAVEEVGGPDADDWIEGLALCVLSGLSSRVKRKRPFTQRRPELGRLFFFLEYEEKAAKLRWAGARSARLAYL